ncbi:MAG TPA: VWA domain-containing protein, partial [Planctomycetota bacterium]|nr:VWA domain-containing protein [Planctomycetota bacterium]
WQENQEKLVIDPAKAAPPEFNFEHKTDGYEVTYYDIPVVENRIVFVLDMSGSMQWGGNPSRWDSASSELKKIIGRLNDKQHINIIAFASGTNRWKRKEALVPANEMNRKEALKFIDTLKALGGTQTADVMEDVIRDIASVHGCEAVYLVTDGSPNPWARDITSAIQERYITWYNQAWKVRINTIGIYTTTAKEKTTVAKEEDQEGMKAFLYNLAANNDGMYREIGKN